MVKLLLVFFHTGDTIDSSKAVLVESDRLPFTSAERQRLKELERENRELRRSNDILRQASAYFAKAEFDRLWKK